MATEKKSINKELAALYTKNKKYVYNWYLDGEGSTDYLISDKLSNLNFEFGLDTSIAGAEAPATITLSDGNASAFLKTIAAAYVQVDQNKTGEQRTLKTYNFLAPGSVSVSGVDATTIYGGAVISTGCATCGGGGNFSTNATSRYENVDAIVENGANLHIEGATVTTVYGGGAGYGSILNGGVELVFTNTNRIGTVYGGGQKGAVVNGDVNITVSRVDNMDGGRIGTLYAGGDNSVVNGNVNVTIDGSNAVTIGTISGSGKGTKARVNGTRTLEIADYTGKFTSTIKEFDEIVISGSSSIVLTQTQNKTIQNAKYEFVVDKSTLAQTGTMLTWDKTLDVRGFYVTIDGELMSTVRNGFTTTIFSSTQLTQDQFDKAGMKIYDEAGNEVSGNYALKFVADTDTKGNPKAKGGSIVLEYAGGVHTVSGDEDYIGTAANDEVTVETDTIMKGNIELGAGKNIVDVQGGSQVSGSIVVDRNSTNTIYVDGTINKIRGGDKTTDNIVYLNSPVAVGYYKHGNPNNEEATENPNGEQRQFVAQSLQFSGESNDTVYLAKTSEGALTGIDFAKGDDTLVANADIDGISVTYQDGNNVVVANENGIVINDADLKLAGSNNIFVVSNGVRANIKSSAIGAFMTKYDGVYLSQNAMALINDYAVITSFAGDIDLKVAGADIEGLTITAVQPLTDELKARIGEWYVQGDGVNASIAANNKTITLAEGAKVNGTIADAKLVDFQGDAGGSALFFKNAAIKVEKGATATVGSIDGLVLEADDVTLTEIEQFEADAKRLTMGDNAQVVEVVNDRTIVGKITKAATFTGNVAFIGEATAAVTLKDAKAFFGKTSKFNKNITFVGENTVDVNSKDDEKGLTLNNKKIKFADGATAKFHVLDGAKLTIDGLINGAELPDYVKTATVGTNARFAYGNTLRTGSWDKTFGKSQLTDNDKNVEFVAGSTLENGIELSADTMGRNIVIADGVEVTADDVHNNKYAINLGKGEDTLTIGKSTIDGAIEAADGAADTINLNGTTINTTYGNQDAVILGAADTLAADAALVNGAITGGKIVELKNGTDVKGVLKADGKIADDEGAFIIDSKVAVVQGDATVTGASTIGKMEATSYVLVDGSTTLATINEIVGDSATLEIANGAKVAGDAITMSADNSTFKVRNADAQNIVQNAAAKADVALEGDKATVGNITQSGADADITAGAKIVQKYTTEIFPTKLPDIEIGTLERKTGAVYQNATDSTFTGVIAIDADGEYEKGYHKSAKVTVDAIKADYAQIDQAGENNAVTAGIDLSAVGESDVVIKGDAAVKAGDISQLSEVTGGKNTVKVDLSANEQTQAVLDVGGKMTVDVGAISQTAYRADNEIAFNTTALAGDATKAAELAAKQQITVAKVDMRAYQGDDTLEIRGNTEVKGDITVGGVLDKAGAMSEDSAWGDRTATKNTVVVEADTAKLGGNLTMIGLANDLDLRNDTYKDEAGLVGKNIYLSGNDNKVQVAYGIQADNIAFYDLLDHDKIGIEGYELGTGKYANDITLRGTVSKFEFSKNSDDTLRIYGGQVLGDVITKNGTDKVIMGNDDPTVKKVTGDALIQGNLVMGIKGEADGSNTLEMSSFQIDGDDKQYLSKITGNVEMYADEKSENTATLESAVIGTKEAPGSLTMVGGKNTVTSSVDLKAGAVTQEATASDNSFVQKDKAVINGAISQTAKNDNTLSLENAKEIKTISQDAGNDNSATITGVNAASLTQTATKGANTAELVKTTLAGTIGQEAGTSNKLEMWGSNATDVTQKAVGTNDAKVESLFSDGEIIPGSIASLTQTSTESANTATFSGKVTTGTITQTAGTEETQTAGADNTATIKAQAKATDITQTAVGKNTVETSESAEIKGNITQTSTGDTTIIPVDEAANYVGLKDFVMEGDIVQKATGSNVVAAASNTGSNVIKGNITQEGYFNQTGLATGEKVPEPGNVNLEGSLTQTAKSGNALFAVASTVAAQVEGLMAPEGESGKDGYCEYHEGVGDEHIGGKTHASSVIVSNADFNTHKVTGDIVQIVTSDAEGVKGYTANGVAITNYDLANIKQTNVAAGNEVSIQNAGAIEKKVEYVGEITEALKDVTYVATVKDVSTTKVGDISQIGVKNAIADATKAKIANEIAMTGVNAGTVTQAAELEGNVLTVKAVEDVTKDVVEAAKWDPAKPGYDKEVFTNTLVGDNKRAGNTLGAVKQTIAVSGNYAEGELVSTQQVANKINLANTTVAGEQLLGGKVAISQTATKVNANVKNDLVVQTEKQAFVELDAAGNKVAYTRLTDEAKGTSVFDKLEGAVVQSGYENAATLKNVNSGAIDQDANMISTVGHHGEQFTGNKAGGNTLNVTGESDDAVAAMGYAAKDNLAAVRGSITQDVYNQDGQVVDPDGGVHLADLKAKNEATIQGVEVEGVVKQTLGFGDNELTVKATANGTKNILGNDVTQKAKGYHSEELALHQDANNTITANSVDLRGNVVQMTKYGSNKLDATAVEQLTGFKVNQQTSDGDNTVIAKASKLGTIDQDVVVNDSTIPVQGEGNNTVNADDTLVTGTITQAIAKKGDNSVTGARLTTEGEIAQKTVEGSNAVDVTGSVIGGAVTQDTVLGNNTVTAVETLVKGAISQKVDFRDGLDLASKGDNTINGMLFETEGEITQSTNEGLNTVFGSEIKVGGKVEQTVSETGSNTIEVETFETAGLVKQLVKDGDNLVDVKMAKIGGMIDQDATNGANTVKMAGTAEEKSTVAGDITQDTSAGDNAVSATETDVAGKIAQATRFGGNEVVAESGLKVRDEVTQSTIEGNNLVDIKMASEIGGYVKQEAKVSGDNAVALSDSSVLGKDENGVAIAQNAFVGSNTVTSSVTVKDTKDKIGGSIVQGTTDGNNAITAKDTLVDGFVKQTVKGTGSNNVKLVDSDILGKNKDGIAIEQDPTVGDNTVMSYATEAEMPNTIGGAIKQTTATKGTFGNQVTANNTKVGGFVEQAVKTEGNNRVYSALNLTIDGYVKQTTAKGNNVVEGVDHLAVVGTVTQDSQDGNNDVNVSKSTIGTVDVDGTVKQSAKTGNNTVQAGETTIFGNVVQDITEKGENKIDSTLLGGLVAKNVIQHTQDGDNAIILGDVVGRDPESKRSTLGDVTQTSDTVMTADKDHFGDNTVDAYAADFGSIDQTAVYGHNAITSTTQTVAGEKNDRLEKDDTKVVTSTKIDYIKQKGLQNAITTEDVTIKAIKQSAIALETVPAADATPANTIELAGKHVAVDWTAKPEVDPDDPTTWDVINHQATYAKAVVEGGIEQTTKAVEADTGRYDHKIPTATNSIVATGADFLGDISQKGDAATENFVNATGVYIDDDKTIENKEIEPGKWKGTLIDGVARKVNTIAALTQDGTTNTATIDTFVSAGDVKQDSRTFATIDYDYATLHAGYDYLESKFEGPINNTLTMKDVTKAGDITQTVNAEQFEVRKFNTVINGFEVEGDASADGDNVATIVKTDVKKVTQTQNGLDGYAAIGNNEIIATEVNFGAPIDQIAIKGDNKLVINTASTAEKAATTTVDGAITQKGVQNTIETGDVTVKGAITQAAKGVTVDDPLKNEVTMTGAVIDKKTVAETKAESITQTVEMVPVSTAYEFYAASVNPYNKVELTAADVGDVKQTGNASTGNTLAFTGAKAEDAEVVYPNTIGKVEQTGVDNNAGIKDAKTAGAITQTAVSNKVVSYDKATDTATSGMINYVSNQAALNNVGELTGAIEQTATSEKFEILEKVGDAPATKKGVGVVGAKNYAGLTDVNAKGRDITQTVKDAEGKTGGKQGENQLYVENSDIGNVAQSTGYGDNYIDIYTHSTATAEMTTETGTISQTGNAQNFINAQDVKMGAVTQETSAVEVPQYVRNSFQMTGGVFDATEPVLKEGEDIDPTKAESYEFDNVRTTAKVASLEQKAVGKVVKQIGATNFYDATVDMTNNFAKLEFADVEGKVSQTGATARNAFTFTGARAMTKKVEVTTKVVEGKEVVDEVKLVDDKIAIFNKLGDVEQEGVKNVATVINTDSAFKVTQTADTYDTIEYTAENAYTTAKFNGEALKNELTLEGTANTGDIVQTAKGGTFDVKTFVDDVETGVTKGSVDGLNKVVVGKGANVKGSITQTASGKYMTYDTSVKQNWVSATDVNIVGDVTQTLTSEATAFQYDSHTNFIELNTVKAGALKQTATGYGINLVTNYAGTSEIKSIDQKAFMNTVDLTDAKIAGDITMKTTKVADDKALINTQVNKVTLDKVEVNKVSATTDVIATKFLDIHGELVDVTVAAGNSAVKLTDTTAAIVETGDGNDKITLAGKTKITDTIDMGDNTYKVTPQGTDPESWLIEKAGEDVLEINSADVNVFSATIKNVEQLKIGEGVKKLEAKSIQADNITFAEATGNELRAKTITVTGTITPGVTIFVDDLTLGKATAGTTIQQYSTESTAMTVMLNNGIQNANFVGIKTGTEDTITVANNATLASSDISYFEKVTFETAAKADKATHWVWDATVTTQTLAFTIKDLDEETELEKSVTVGAIDDGYLATGKSTVNGYVWNDNLKIWTTEEKKDAVKLAIDDTYYTYDKTSGTITYDKFTYLKPLPQTNDYADGVSKFGLLADPDPTMADKSYEINLTGAVNVNGDVTTYNGGDTINVNKGETPDTKIFGKVSLGGGADKIVLNEDAKLTTVGTIDFGEGGDSFMVGTGATFEGASVDFGAGDDDMKVSATATFNATTLDFGAGNDTLTVNESINTTKITNVEAVSVADTKTLTADVEVDDNLSLKGTVVGTITEKTAAKTLTLSGNASATTVSGFGSIDTDGNTLTANVKSAGNLYLKGTVDGTIAETVTGKQLALLGDASVSDGVSGFEQIAAGGNTLKANVTTSSGELKFVSACKIDGTITGSGTTELKTNAKLSCPTVEITGDVKDFKKISIANGVEFTLGGSAAGAEIVGGAMGNETLTLKGTTYGTIDLLGGSDTLNIEAAKTMITSITNVESVNFAAGASAAGGTDTLSYTGYADLNKVSVSKTLGDGESLDGLNIGKIDLYNKMTLNIDGTKVSGVGAWNTSGFFTYNSTDYEYDRKTGVISYASI